MDTVGIGINIYEFGGGSRPVGARGRVREPGKEEVRLAGESTGKLTASPDRYAWVTNEISMASPPMMMAAVQATLR